MTLLRPRQDDRMGKSVTILYPLVIDQNMPTGETFDRMMANFFLL